MVTGFGGPLDREIKIIGEVAQPMAVPYRAQMSVLDLMIMAKGLTRFADGNRTVIVRHVADHTDTYGVRLDDLLKNGGAAPALRTLMEIAVPLVQHLARQVFRAD